MTSLEQFIKDMHITGEASRVDSNPNMGDRENMTHWRVALRTDEHRMAVYFSMGSAHNGKAPEVAYVLDCLASDASSVDNADSFEEWAREYGYDTDSRKALRTYTICKRQQERLLRFLGPSAYQELLYETERL